MLNSEGLHAALFKDGGRTTSASKQYAVLITACKLYVVAIIVFYTRAYGLRLGLNYFVEINSFVALRLFFLLHQSDDESSSGCGVNAVLFSFFLWLSLPHSSCFSCIVGQLAFASPLTASDYNFARALTEWPLEPDAQFLTQDCTDQSEVLNEGDTKLGSTHMKSRSLVNIDDLIPLSDINAGASVHGFCESSENLFLF